MGIGSLGGNQPWIKPGVNSSSPASPGAGGAISDFIAALARATPIGQELTQRPGIQNQAVQQASQ